MKAVRLLALAQFAMMYSLLSTHAYAWGPEWDSDQIGTSPQFGSNFFLQTITATSHFGLKNERLNNYFLNQERPELEAEKEKFIKQREKSEAKELMDLSWFLGAAYYRTSAFDPVSNTNVSDSAYALKIGINWELQQRANIIAGGGYEVLPAENYSQGFFELGFLYTIPLGEGCDWDDSVIDGEQYYVGKQNYDNCAKYPAKDRFPNIQLGVLGNYMQATKSRTTSGRTAGSAGVVNPVSGSSLQGDTNLNESASGPEIVFNLHRLLYLRGKALFYFYRQQVAPFLNYTTIGAFRPKADFAVADLEDTFPLLLQYPKRQFAGSVTLRVGPNMNLRGELLYSTFDATSTVLAGTLSDVVSAGGILDIALASRFKIGGMLDQTVGGNGYKATVGGLFAYYAL